MTIQDVFSKKKIANVSKYVECGKCCNCNKNIEFEDEEVGFYGNEIEWEEYNKQYSGYLELNEEYEVITETENEVELKAYYDLEPEQAEFTLYERNKCLAFCSQECLDTYIEKIEE